MDNVFVTLRFGPCTVLMEQEISNVRTLLIIDEYSVSIAHRRFVHSHATKQSVVNAWLDSHDFMNLECFLTVAPHNESRLFENEVLGAKFLA